MTEAVIICSANQWTGFYMVTASAMKELKKYQYRRKIFVMSEEHFFFTVLSQIDCLKVY